MPSVPVGVGNTALSIALYKKGLFLIRQSVTRHRPENTRIAQPFDELSEEQPARAIAGLNRFPQLPPNPKVIRFAMKKVTPSWQAISEKPLN
jgi:hypothetical protein